MMRGLAMLARSTRVTIVLDKRPHTGPDVLPTDKFQGLVLTSMPRDQVIVLKVEPLPLPLPILPPLLPLPDLVPVREKGRQPFALTVGGLREL